MSSRFDIIAVRNCDHKLCVIELKKGVGALGGTAGIQAHAESFVNSIGCNEDTQKDFVEEMKGLIQLKKMMGLISDEVYIDEMLSVEFLYAYQFKVDDKSPISEKEQKDTFLKYLNNGEMNGVNYASGRRVLWLKENCFTLMD